MVPAQRGIIALLVRLQLRRQRAALETIVLQHLEALLHALREHTALLLL